MFEFYQDFALGWLGYSHKGRQTQNRATNEVLNVNVVNFAQFFARNAGRQPHVENEER
jgi:hypothetical protein